MDPAVPPVGVLASQPPDQCPDTAPGRWPPGPPARGPGAQRRRTMSRCQRTIVSGVTSSRSPWRRAFGITPSRVASRARSAQFSFGRRGCRRCSTASWWRRIKISVVFHISSRRDSRNPAATRVIRRNTNRRHMIGDHHGRTAKRATLLVRAMGELLGTHRRQPGACPLCLANRRAAVTGPAGSRPRASALPAPRKAAPGWLLHDGHGRASAPGVRLGTCLLYTSPSPRD